jgi:D-alanyl-D-alanine carboxypeptidase/D-alanyl-D-alanine-endopeptidase (penicillin-binding protein 4)
MRRVPFALPLFLACTVVIAGCAKQAPGTAPTPVRTAAISPTHAVDRLRAELASTFQSPAASALWAAKVQSLESGEVLFEQNAHTLVMPASNMKIVTMAVAAERLGWDYRFPTTIETAGRIENGVLTGDLVVVGHGDPTISDRGGSRTRVFEHWADRLREQGINEIRGSIIGDDNAFDDDALGDGWAWDDLAAGYAAPPSALAFNENVASIVVRARLDPGQPAQVTLDPPDSGLSLTAHVIVGEPTSAPNVSVWRRPFDSLVEVTGSVPKAERDYVRTVSLENPTLAFVQALRETLVRKGIVAGVAVDVDVVDPPRIPVVTDLPRPSLAAVATPRTVLLTHQSPPLSEIGVPFMKVSQNLFGETLMTTLGLAAGLEPCPPLATVNTCRGRAIASAQKVYEQVLTSWGIDPGSFIVRDGSGLSRYNFLTADLLVTVLRRMARDPRHATLFDATLPIMGKDGTLARRLRGTRAEGNVHAKTGSISNVRALSGYLTTAGGERLVFSIIANNFKAPSAVIDGIADQAIERLVSFER